MALIAAGLAMLLSSGLRVLKAFHEERLLTDGLFAVFPNPMYAAFVLAVVPGLALVLNSWLVLTGAALVYGLSRLLVPGEDRWLKDRFDAAYEAYRRRVLVKIFPEPCTLRAGSPSVVTSPRRVSSPSSAGGGQGRLTGWRG